MRTPSELRPLAALLLAAVLTACTGTTEPRPPTLLLVGAAPGGAPQLLLVEDVTGTAPAGEPRLRVVPGSGRQLLAPAVSIDLEDRSGGRQAAWVLSRSVADAGGSPVVSSYLQRFRVLDVDPAEPGDFAEDQASRVTLTDPGGNGVLDGLSLTSPTTCPTHLQVDRSGTFAAVLDDPGACGSGDHPELWLVPLDGGESESLQGTNDVVALAPYLDQRPDDELLYFIVGGIDEGLVYVRPLAASTSRRVTQVPETATALIDASGAGDSLVLASSTALLPVDLEAAAALERTPTRAGAEDVVTDPTGLAPEVLVLGDGAIVVHSGLADADPDVWFGSGVAATIDPVTRFAYVVSEGAMAIVDLLSGGDTGRPLRVVTEELPELALPSAGQGGPFGAEAGPVTAVAWVRAALPPTE